MEKEIIWTNTASNHLDKIHRYLLKKTKSLKIANMVIDGIYNSTKILKSNPEIFNLSKLKVNNDGSIRRYEKYHYTITYKISGTKIYILRIRHSSREPLEF